VPELPEVETTRRGIEPHTLGRRLATVRVHEPRLRWPVEPALPSEAAGQTVQAVRRRAKYLLLDLERGSLMLHLGMSGSLRVMDSATARLLHDHVDFELDSGQTLRFNDPRRFGSLHWLAAGEETGHPLLRHLGPEPLDDAFDGEVLHRAARGRRVAIKQFIMDSHVVVGVGNIYASEALFQAGVRPGRAARSLSRADCQRLATQIREVLGMAIRAGGTTLRDYVNADGTPGYFRQKLYVYERAGEPCRRCDEPIRQRVQGQRSTYYCSRCQC
jgi:formamidopyrimidine-DNA glycosylase